MNINQLAIFHAVAEEGSVTRAAERLYISQPAVSKSLRELERSLGMALFHRLSKGVKLTEGGELLLGYSRSIFALEREAESALSELRNLERGRLRVGASTTIGTYILPPVCARFGRHYPRVELALDIDNSRAIEERLSRNQIDLALVEGPPNPETEWQADTFLTDEVVPIAAGFHPLGCLKELDFAMLAEQPLLLREAGSGTRAVVEAAFEARGLTPNVKMSLGNSEAIKRSVAAGVGLAWMSRLAVETEIQTGMLKVLCGPGLILSRPLHRLRVQGRYESRAVREFLRLLRSHVSGESEELTADGHR